MLTCLFRLIWPSFELSLRKKKEESVSTRPVGFAAGKKQKFLNRLDINRNCCLAVRLPFQLKNPLTPSQAHRHDSTATSANTWTPG